MAKSKKSSKKALRAEQSPVDDTELQRSLAHTVQLFNQRDFAAAYEEFTKAIQGPGSHSIAKYKLFSNRSACCFCLGRYENAVDDAEQAIKESPNDWKAWGRLALAQQQIGNWSTAGAAFETALEKSKKVSFASAEEKREMRSTLQASFCYARKSAAEEKHRKLNSSRTEKLEGNMPYDKARQILSSTKVTEDEEDKNTSALVISQAHEHLCEAMEGLKQRRDVLLYNGKITMTGKLSVLESLTNAIMRDRRVFPFDHARQGELLGEINKQIVLESVHADAWYFERTEWDSRSIADLFGEAQERIATRGWEKTRKALSTTVRTWILRAFLCSRAGNYRDATTHYHNILDLLYDGKEAWKDVERKERGVIFDDSFAIGVRAMQLESFKDAYVADPNAYPLEILQGMAVSLEQDARESRSIFSKSDDVKRGFRLSFHVYPLATAIQMQGFCLYEYGVNADNVSHGRDFIEKSMAKYLEAKQVYPQDDELTCICMIHVLECIELLGADVEIFSSHLAKLRASQPSVMKLWDNSEQSRAIYKAKIAGSLEIEDLLSTWKDNGELGFLQALPPMRSVGWQ